MPTEQNKSVVRRSVEEIWGKGQTELTGQLFMSDVCDHNPLPGQPRGMEGQSWVVDMYRRASPDMRITLEVLLAEGDWVAHHCTCTGTQTGELFGFPPSGRPFNISATYMYRLSNGKIAEIWHMEDILSLMQQLGAIPAAPQAGTATGRSAGARATPRDGAKKLSADEKQALIRRSYLEYVDRANPDIADEALTPDYVGHFSAMPPINGRDEYKKFISMHNNVFTDHHAELEDFIVEGDLVACRITLIGRHTGELHGIAPTGKLVRGPGLGVFRFEGDRIAEQWNNVDDLGLLVQLGVVPAMAGAEVAGPC